MHFQTKIKCGSQFHPVHSNQTTKKEHIAPKTRSIQFEKSSFRIMYFRLQRINFATYLNAHNINITGKATMRRREFTSQIKINNVRKKTILYEFPKDNISAVSKVQRTKELDNSKIFQMLVKLRNYCIRFRFPM